MRENKLTRTGFSRRGFLGAAAATAGATVASHVPKAQAGIRQPAEDLLVPTGLMTALQDDALGVGTPAPRLTWQVPVAAGKLQRACEIQLVRDPLGFAGRTRIESTGVVRGDQSVAVPWPFAPLAARSIGYWRVRAWLGDDQVTAWSAPARVVQGPLTDADWGGADTIWAAPVPPTPTYADAALSCDIEISSARAGVFIRTSPNVTNGYMWQLNPGTSGLLRQHILVNGVYTVLNEVTLPVAIPAAGPFNLRIVASGDTITTYINGTLADSTSGLNPAAGAFGFRTGGSESFWVDNVLITDPDGTVIYSNDYDTQVPYPETGHWDNGRMFVGTSTAGVFDQTTADGYWAFLRAEFTLPPGRIAGAFLHISAQFGSPKNADGAADLSARQHVYRAWCNGTHIGVGPTQARDHPRYQTHDLTGVLRPGQSNALAAQCWTRSQQQFIALLDVHYSDGRTVTLTSGPAWSARHGGLALQWAGGLNTPYYVAPAEYFDARHEPAGWKEPGYQGDDFAPATVTTALTGLAPAGTVNVAQVPRRPVSVVQVTPGSWIVDVGKELTGAVRLTVDAPAALAGSVVDLRLGEELNADGSVRYNLRCGVTYHDVWTLREGPQEIEHWGYRSFRWVQLTADPALDLSNAVTILQQVAPQPELLGSFTSSSPDLDKVYDFCAYTVSAARLDLYPDSPTRERWGTEGDLCVHAKSEMAVSRSYDLIRHANKTFLVNDNYETWTEYWFQFATTAWDEYLQTGDPDSIAAMWDAEVAAQGTGWFDADGLVSKPVSTASHNDLVDWPHGTETDGFVFTNVNTVVNAWQYQALVLLRKMAVLLGKTSDAATYGGYAATMRDSMNRLLYDAETGAYFDGAGTSHQAQHSSLYAASLGVAEPAELPKIAAWLASDTANPVRVSCNAARWLIEALILGGRMDAALDIMTSRRVTSWLAMIEQWGATQTMEGWSPAHKGNLTFSHPWASGPAEIIARYVLGVQVVTPGAAAILVAPQLGSLAHADGIVPTIRGPVRVRAEQSPSYSVTVETPGNTVGTLRWPAAGHPLSRFDLSGPPGCASPALDGDTVEVSLLPGTTVLAARP